MRVVVFLYEPALARWNRVSYDESGNFPVKRVLDLDRAA